MFYHAFDNYMKHAYPAAELLPVSCQGGQFDLIKLPLVTLIDTLDTLVILGDHKAFRKSVEMVLEAFPSFDVDVDVSVFETTIRILGGLLSAHLMASDAKLGLYPATDGLIKYTYDAQLLHLARDLGNRLLEAFDTGT
jgi:mannosidase alpha-like ER degradation enhancer 2